MRPGLVAAGLGAMALTARAAFGATQADSALVVQPAQAAIDVFYSGVRLTVSAQLDTGLAVAVLVAGAEADLHLRRQARVWRAFWAPSGEVTFAHVPELYLLRASAALTTLAPPALLGELGLRYESFRSRPRGAGAEGAGEAGDLFAELVRLKESQGLFQVVTGAVQTEPAGAGRQRVTASLDVPAKAPPGVYRVRLFGFRDGHVATRREGEFTLTRGTFNGLFNALAERHGLLYGITAVVLAIGAGLLVGLVFGSVKAH
jgi:uncharacterized protein (TIGR02186 family)